MTTQTITVKRVKRQIKTSQNPLFEKWLKEWKEEAAKNGSDMQYCFSKALKSLQKFPVKLYSGKECMMLENFGVKLCQKLDDQLEIYKRSHPDDLSVYPKTLKDNQSSLDSLFNQVTKATRKRKSCEVSPDNDKGTDVETIEEKKKKNSTYVPSYRSGGYAILIAMLEDEPKVSLTRTEIENKAQDFCDSSFKKPPPGSYYTAWSSMSVLIKKNLVHKEGKPARFRLTELGIDLAAKLKYANEFYKKNNSTGDGKELPLVIPKSPVKNSPTKPTESSVKESETISEADETVFLLPGTFEIILLVDLQERDNKFQQAKGMTVKELEKRNVNFEIRHLKVGDFIWIAKDLQSGSELVLPYIVERKRMDDLASSIKDGRFHEQKFRLKNSGIQNLIYLVEKHGHETQKLGLPLPTLMQAVSNTQIVDGFSVRLTNSHDHSMRYLNCMTTQLSNWFKAKTLVSCKKSNLPPINLSDDLVSLMTFKDFNKGAEKNKKLTIRNMLVRHLIQLNGVSVEKAQAIVDIYPTPKALITEMKKSSGEKKIADITYGNFSRSIGPATAKQIRLLYSNIDLK